MVSEREALAREVQTVEAAMRKAQAKLAALADEQVQKKRALQRSDAEATRAADWVVQQNAQQNAFRRRVWGPVGLEMHVHEALHARFLEGLLPRWLLTAFVVECYEDYNTLLEAFSTGSNGRASVLIVHEGQCHPVARPFSETAWSGFQEQFGFQRYADELVTAPAVIHEVLRSYGHVHTVLVGTRKTEELINRGTNVSVDHRGVHAA